MKKILLSVFMLCFTLLANAQYHLEWDEHAYLEIPDPPFNGYVAHATWNVNNSNLTFKEAEEIRKRSREGVSWKVLAEEFKISYSTIRRILAGKTHKAPTKKLVCGRL